jgi:hypothetical protein
MKVYVISVIVHLGAGKDLASGARELIIAQPFFAARNCSGLMSLDCGQPTRA